MSDQGYFVWHELMTTDPEAAQRFYTAVLPWGTQPFSIPGMPPYTMFTSGDVPLGGMMQLPPEAAGAPPHWLGYIAVDDVDAMADKAASLGGAVMVKPQDIPEVGRFSVIRDPQGAYFAIYRSGTPGEAPGRPPVGRVSWNELGTSDDQAGWAFYSGLFGWTICAEHDMGPLGIYRLYGPSADVPIGGISRRDPSMGPPAWTYYMRVADLDATLASVKANGGQVMMGPHEVPGGDRIGICMDPQGGVFALHWANPAGPGAA